MFAVLLETVVILTSDPQLSIREVMLNPRFYQVSTAALSLNYLGDGVSKVVRTAQCAIAQWSWTVLFGKLHAFVPVALTDRYLPARLLEVVMDGLNRDCHALERLLMYSKSAIAKQWKCSAIAMAIS